MGFDVRASDLELWHVQMPAGVVTMTLDELDSAFQNGAIDERTMVLKSGGLHWMTLSDIAGLDDASATPPPVQTHSPYSQPYAYCDEPQPNSIAPIAIDMSRPSALSIPPLPPVNFDVSFGTEEREIFKPKRSYGAVVGTVAAVAIVAGGLFAVKSMGAQGLKAKVASISSMVQGRTKGADARSLAIAPPAAADPPPVFNPSAPPMNNAKSAPIEPPPITPPVQADKNGKKNGKDASKKTTKAAPTKKGGGSAKSSGASDPTQKGSGQFDPLNGNL